MRETESKDGIFGCFFQHMGIRDEKGLGGRLANRAEEEVEIQYGYLDFSFICPLLRLLHVILHKETCSLESDKASMGHKNQASRNIRGPQSFDSSELIARVSHMWVPLN